MKELLGSVAVILGIISVIPYIRDIYRGKTKPHLFSNLIWAIVTTIAFFGQLVSGAGPGSWTTIVMAILTVYILVLCRKYGTKDITKLDLLFLIFGLLSIIPWMLTKDPTISVVIATTIDICGFIPTIRKTYHAPESETRITWILNAVRHFISLFALKNISVNTALYPSALLIMNIITVLVILRKKKGHV